MSNITNSPEHDARYLLQLMQADLHNKLVQVAIDAIRPSIHAEVHKVMAELQPKVEQHFDHLRNALTIALITKEIK